MVVVTVAVEESTAATVALAVEESVVAATVVATIAIAMVV